MNIYFINPPFKAEYGKFSRESRSPAITKSGALYYPLWLIYAALYSSKQGHNVSFLDAPAKQLNEEQSLNIIRKTDNEHSLFVLDTSTPSIKSDVAFAGKLKAIVSSLVCRACGDSSFGLRRRDVGLFGCGGCGRYWRI